MNKGDRELWARLTNAAERQRNPRLTSGASECPPNADNPALIYEALAAIWALVADKLQ